MIRSTMDRSCSGSSVSSIRSRSAGCTATQPRPPSSNVAERQAIHSRAVEVLLLLLDSVDQGHELDLSARGDVIFDEEHNIPSWPAGGATLGDELDGTKAQPGNRRHRACGRSGRPRRPTATSRATRSPSCPAQAAARCRPRRDPAPPRRVRPAGPSVILVRTNPGRTMCTETPVPRSDFAQPQREAVEPRFGRPVDEVGRAGPGQPATEDRTTMRPWPCCSSWPPRRRHGGGGPGQVDRQHLRRSGPGRSRRPPGGPSSPTATMTRSTASPAASKHWATVLSAPSVVGRVELDRLDVWRPSRAVRRPPRPRAAGRVRRGRPTGSGRRPQRRRFHARCRRSLPGRRPIAGARKRRSSCQSRAGGTGRTQGRRRGRRDGRPRAMSSEPGVHDRRGARVAGGSPWPGRRVHPRPATSRPGDPGGRGGPADPRGKSRARVHPSWAKESGPGVPGPKRFRTARNEGRPDDAIAADRLHSTTSPRWGETANWYCTNPAGP